MKCLIVIALVLISAVCSAADGQQIDPRKVEGMFQTVVAQRNQAQDQVAQCGGELIYLQARIKELEAAIAKKEEPKK